MLLGRRVVVPAAVADDTDLCGDQGGVVVAVAGAAGVGVLILRVAGMARPPGRR